MSEETICFDAGHHRDVIQMNTEDWEDLVRPSVLAFAHATDDAASGRLACSGDERVDYQARHG
ncbi:MAG: hypothetical protein QM757_11170 [Paludibaculum sp.]